MSSPGIRLKAEKILAGGSIFKVFSTKYSSCGLSQTFGSDQVVAFSVTSDINLETIPLPPRTI